MKKDYHDILIRPFLTEKVTTLHEKENKVCFLVKKDANKVEIKKAVESILKVQVDKVNVMNFTGKKKRLGKHVGKKSDWKKALISLKEGQKLEIFGS